MARVPAVARVSLFPPSLLLFRSLLLLLVFPTYLVAPAVVCVPTVVSSPIVLALVLKTNILTVGLMGYDYRMCNFVF
jgi:hypothetical protein